MMWIGTAAAWVSLWLLGALALEATGLRGARGTGRVVADVAAGAALLAYLGTMMIVAGVRLSLVPFYLLILGLATVAALRGRWIRIAPSFPEDRIAALLLAGAGALVLIVALASMQDRLWWDGWSIWAFKARVLFLDGTLPRSFLDPEGGYAFTQLAYPLAVPLVDWWIYRHAGAAAPALASFAGAVWFALLPLLLWGALRTRAGERVAALASLGMAAFWPVAFYATGGTADVVVALALLGAVVELECGLGRRDRAALWRCAIYLFLGAMAKNEGLALALVAALAGGVALIRTGERRAGRFVPFALPFLAAAPWWIYAGLIGLDQRVVSLSVSPGAWPERLSFILGAVGAVLSSWLWLPLPLLAAVGVLAAARRPSPGSGVGWAVLGGYFALVCGVYLFTRHELVWIITTSLHRVLGAGVPALVYLAVRGAAGTEESRAPEFQEAIRDAALV